MTQQPYQPPPGGWAPQPEQQPAGQWPGQGQQPAGYPPYPQQPPAGPPPGYGPPPPQPAYPPADVTGQPWAQQQQAPAGPPAPAGDDPFGAPDAPRGGGGDNPGIHQLSGRLVLIRPYSFDPRAAGHPSDPGKLSPLVMADLIVCDGPPLDGNINGETDQFTPFAAGPKTAPFYCGGMYIRGAVMPDQLQSYVGSRGQCLGRVVKGKPGKSGKPPWVLADPTEQDKVIGRQIHAAWDQIKAAGAPPAADSFGAPVQGQQAPSGYPQQPAQPQYQQQGPPPGYPAQNPYGAPPAQAPYPPAPQGPPPGYPPAPGGYPPPYPTH